MAYTKTNWVNGETPINAQNLNKIENGIEANDNYINRLHNTNLLFSGSAGSSDTITPPSGDSFSNYRFLLIVAGWYGQNPSTLVVPYISGQNYTMSSFNQTTSSVYWLCAGRFAVYENQITIADGGQMNLMDASAPMQNFDCFKITKVYGIK